MELLADGQRVIFTFNIDLVDATDGETHLNYNKLPNDDKAEIIKYFTSDEFKEIVNAYFISITPAEEDPLSYDEDGQPIYENEFTGKVIDIDVLVDKMGYLIIDIKLELTGHGKVLIQRLVKLANGFIYDINFIEYIGSLNNNRIIFQEFEDSQTIKIIDE